MVYHSAIDITIFQTISIVVAVCSLPIKSDQEKRQSAEIRLGKEMSNAPERDGYGVGLRFDRTVVPGAAEGTGDAPAAVVGQRVAAQRRNLCRWMASPASPSVRTMRPADEEK